MTLFRVFCLTGFLGLSLLLGACESTPKTEKITDPDLVVNMDKDPTARSFSGYITALRPTTNTMLVVMATGNDIDSLNQVRCQWTPQTKFYLDDQPATLDQITQYMTVKIKGHVQNDRLITEVAKFSSVLPPNVLPSTQPATKSSRTPAKG